MGFSVTPVSPSYLDSTQLGSGAPSPVSGAPPAVPSTTAPAAKPIKDTVTLSTTAQAQAMEQGGASVSQIAANLGLTAAEVDQELGLATPAPSSQSSILAALSARKK